MTVGHTLGEFTHGPKIDVATAAAASSWSVGETWL